MSRRRIQPTPQTTLIRGCNPSGSSTVFWVENMSGPGQYLYMVRQGDRLFAPAIPGMRLGLGLYNGSCDRRAYPIYIEGVNLAYGGPSDPNTCRSTQMRQVEPYSQTVVSHTFTPAVATGRPLAIVAHGDGYGFGEATFDRTDLHGLIHVYERSSNRDGCQTYPSYGGYMPKGSPQRDGQPPLLMDEPTRTMRGPQVGIGAGAETHQTDHLVRTSTTYATDATLVVALQLKSPAELSRMLDAAGLDRPNSWYWQPEERRWYAQMLTTTAPQVPVAPMAPHIGPRNNRGSQGYGSL